MSLWSLGLGFLCCVMVRVVFGTESKDSIVSNQIPDSYLKSAEGNSLWFNLLHDCKNSSASCIKQTSYNYLNELLTYSGDVEVTRNIILEKNDVDYESISGMSKNDTSENDIEGTSPLEELTGKLHDKAVKFMMTHDVVIRMPEYLFDGALLKVSPRTFDGDAAVIKLDTFPGQGRIFFKKISK